MPPSHHNRISDFEFRISDFQPSHPRCDLRDKWASLGGAWHPDSWRAVTEDRAKKRAVSDDFGEVELPINESVESQTSSEGALLGSALVEQLVDSSSI
jgi:hypothetical protein